MELYAETSYLLADILTKKYSTSFSMSMRLFPRDMRPHIAAIYGLVRIADEIVDEYRGSEQQSLLDDLERETYAAIKRGYSTNPIVHAFALTAERYKIERPIIEPFFRSMRLDCAPMKYSQKKYEQYIEGSAEVVGLMCLKVFVDDEKLYASLEDGARHLGAAYQKVNFLRDIAADHTELSRWYFPTGSFETFDDVQKSQIIADIDHDFAVARPAIDALPRSARSAVMLSYKYYSELLDKIVQTPASTLKRRRVRVPQKRKVQLLMQALVSKRRG